jgi:hypothetical protein
MADGAGLVAPLVLARTELITRTVVTVPAGQAVLDEATTTVDDGKEHNNPTSRMSFWTEFVRDLSFDDPEQQKPRAGRQEYVTSPLPVPGGHC